MASIVPVQGTMAISRLGDQEDLESGIETPVRSSTISVNEVSISSGERGRIVADGKGATDTVSRDFPSAWTKKHLIAAYVLIWAITATCTLFDNILNALGPYVTSAFHLHSYSAATGIVANIVGGLATFPTSKLLQRCGRAQGLAAMLLIGLLGLVMLAACQNVQTFAAAQVFTSIGATGVIYCISVFVADTTSLRNRGLVMSFTTSPSIVTMWLGGPIASSLLRGPGWRWGFGIFSIVLPVALIPFIALVFWNQRKADQIGLLQREDTAKDGPSKQSHVQLVKGFALELDVPGLLILASGLSLLLLPFTLYSFQRRGFGSPLIISFLTIGATLTAIYILYERYLAPTATLPFRHLVDRTTLLALLTFTLTIIAFTNIVGYLTSYLQVVTDLSITQTSYLIASIRVTICVWTLLIGALIRWTGRLKILVLVVGIPPMIIAAGLYIHFRGPVHSGLGIMVAVVVLISIALGTVTLCSTLIMMAALGQEHNATVLALTVFFSQISPAIGEAINTGIWTGVFKRALYTHVSEYISDGLVETIYDSIDVQLSFPEGSEVREGIAMAYADAKLWMLVVTLVLTGMCLVSTAAWRDLRVNLQDTRRVESREGGG